MSLLTRFRKPGGLEKLVQLIESSDQKVRENILKNIRAEDPNFTEEVEKKLFFWEDILNLEPMTLTEVVMACKIPHLSAALMYLEDAQRQYIEQCMEIPMRAKIKDEQEILGQPNNALVATARKKIVDVARQLAREGKIQLKGSGQAVVVPDIKDGKMPECVRLNSKEEEHEYAECKKKWDEIFSA